MPYSAMGANLGAVAWVKCRRFVVVMTGNGRRLNGAEWGRLTPDAGRMPREWDA